MNHFGMTVIWGGLVALALGGCAAERGPAWRTPEVRLFRVDKQGAAHPAARQPCVATFNVHWLGEPEKLRGDMGRLEGVDVWALQEVRVAAEEAGKKEGMPELLGGILPAGTWYGVYVPVNRLRELGSDDWEAQAIVSRYPIRRAMVWVLDAEAEKPRVALAAWVDAGGREMLVVNADLAPAFPFGRGVNMRQAEALAGKLREMTPLPTVVAGDFNTTGEFCFLFTSGDHCRLLERTMWTAGFAGADAMPPGQPTFRAGWLRLRLDHAFVRSLRCVEAAVEADAAGSDHRPLWVRIVP